MIDAEHAVVDLTPEQRRRFACDLANIVAHYGHCAPALVDPGWYAASLDRLNIAALTGGEDAQVLASKCLALIDSFDHEPDGAGFYAFGALVSLYNASCSLTGVPDAALNSAKRFLDLLGAADGDGEVGSYDDAVLYVMSPSNVRRAALTARIAAHARSLAA